MNKQDAINIMYEVKHYLTSGNPIWDKDFIREAVEMAIDALEEQPVRCKECRHLKETGGHANCEGYLSCRRTGKAVGDEDYCSWGERV